MAGALLAVGMLEVDVLGVGALGVDVLGVGALGVDVPGLDVPGGATPRVMMTAGADGTFDTGAPGVFVARTVPVPADRAGVAVGPDDGADVPDATVIRFEVPATARTPDGFAGGGAREVCDPAPVSGPDVDGPWATDEDGSPVGFAGGNGEGSDGSGTEVDPKARSIGPGPRAADHRTRDPMLITTPMRMPSVTLRAAAVNAMPNLRLIRPSSRLRTVTHRYGFRVPRRSHPERPDRGIRRGRAAQTEPALLGGWQISVSTAAGEFLVRAVSGASSTKPYRCPACQQLIPQATAHVVVWPADLQGPGVADRRHWHRGCWQRWAARGPRA